MPYTPNPETGTKPQTANPKQSNPGAAKALLVAKAHIDEP